MRRAALLFAALVGMAFVAGCSSAHASRIGARTASEGQAASTGHSCGQAYTAGHVPVVLTVSSGTAACSQVQQVESAYDHEILTGQAPGNGGGGPVKVDGWTCQGLPTPRVLQTGQVSKCANSGGQFVAVLASASPAPTPT